MATRFYLPSTGAAAVSPDYAAWTDTSQASPRRRMVTTRISSAAADLAVYDASGDPGIRYLWRQWVSDPIVAQTISGTVYGQIRCKDDAGGAWDRVSVCIKVVSNDGATLRGTLLSLGQYVTANGFAASLTNRKIADGDSLSSVAASASDRIVIEVGAYTTYGATDSTATASCGDDSGTDLGTNETDTNAYNPWVEFSGTITFGQTSTPDSVEVVASLPAPTSSVTAVPGSVNMLLSPGGGATNVLAVPASVGIVASSSTQTAGMVVDSFNPSAVTNIPVDAIDTVGTVLRPITPSTIGDQTRITYEDSGIITGAATGSVTLYATSIDAPQGVSGSISYLKLYALVSTSDTVPMGKTYVACTSPQFIIKVSGGTRGTYGLISGSVPSQEGTVDQPVWISDTVTVKPGGGSWLWNNLNNIIELGITADYSLASDKYTNLRLDEVWLEVWGPLGSDLPPIELSTQLGQPIRRTLQIISTI